MTTLLRILRSLGPSGALSNAAEPLERRRHEDRLVRELTRRFDGEPERIARAA